MPSAHSSAVPRKHRQRRLRLHFQLLRRLLLLPQLRRRLQLHPSHCSTNPHRRRHPHLLPPLPRRRLLLLHSRFSVSLHRRRHLPLRLHQYLPLSPYFPCSEANLLLRRLQHQLLHLPQLRRHLHHHFHCLVDPNQRHLQSLQLHLHLPVRKLQLPADQPYRSSRRSQSQRPNPNQLPSLHRKVALRCRFLEMPVHKRLHRHRRKPHLRNRSPRRRILSLPSPNGSRTRTVPSPDVSVTVPISVTVLKSPPHRYERELRLVLLSRQDLEVSTG
mmetsp:Transcript_56563/g.137341  ORF Transcript_56563/g.137341 Transcript_56563/m.137341 type:complete len:273 (+) Transcript_56563:1937-2755(+)